MNADVIDGKSLTMAPNYVARANSSKVDEAVLLSLSSPRC